MGKNEKKDLEKPLLIRTHTKDGKDVEEDRRKPFSRFRCIFNAEGAMDHGKSKPFARMKVRIIEAECLMVADLSGLSDPYVVAHMQGTPDHESRKTATLHQTLAPRWNEEMIFDVYHPHAVLSLMIYDEDMGTAFKGVDLLGLDDDHLGWTDIRVDAVAFNEWTEAWLPIAHPDHFSDTLAGRVKKNERKSIEEAKEMIEDEAKIRVQFILEAKQSDEFWACFLPAPCAGHGHPPLNLAQLLDEVQILQKKLTRVTDTFGAFVDYVTSSPTIAMVFLTTMIWKPQDMLPALVMVPPILLRMFVHRAPAVLPGKASSFQDAAKKELKNASSKKALHAKAIEEKAIAKEQAIQRKATATAIEKKAKPAVKPAEPAKQPPGKDTQPAEQPPGEKPKKDSGFVGQMMNKTQDCLDEELQDNLRQTTASIHDALALLEDIESLAASPVVEPLVWLAAIALCACLVAVQDYQEVSLQIVLTLAVFASLFAYTMPGRILLAFLNRYGWGRRMKRSRLNKADLESGDRIRQLTWNEILKLGFYPRELRNWEKEIQQHNFIKQSFGTTTWCKPCGAFLWGVSEQGYRCDACHTICCPKCYKNSKGVGGPPCAGHQLEGYGEYVATH